MKKSLIAVLFLTGCGGYDIPGIGNVGDPPAPEQTEQQTVKRQKLKSVDGKAEF